MLMRPALVAAVILAAGPAAASTVVALGRVNFSLTLEDTDAPVALVASPDVRIGALFTDNVLSDDVTVAPVPGGIEGRLFARDDDADRAFESARVGIDLALVNFSSEAQEVRLELDYLMRAVATAPDNALLDGSGLDLEEGFARARAGLILFDEAELLFEQDFDIIDLRGQSFESREPLFVEVELDADETAFLTLGAAVAGASVTPELGLGGGDAGVAALAAVEPLPTPLPAAAWLMLAGLGALAGLRRARS